MSHNPNSTATTFNPDDPKWTAYVLGELSDAERPEVEAELAASPAAQALVADLRVTTACIEAELKAEPTPRLSPVQRAVIEEQLKPSALLAPRKSFFSKKRVFELGTVAVVAGMLIALMMPGVQARREASRITPMEHAQLTAEPAAQAESTGRQAGSSLGSPHESRGDAKYADFDSLIDLIKTDVEPVPYDDQPAEPSRPVGGMGVPGNGNHGSPASRGVGGPAGLPSEGSEVPAVAGEKTDAYPESEVWRGLTQQSKEYSAEPAAQPARIATAAGDVQHRYVDEGVSRRLRPALPRLGTANSEAYDIVTDNPFYPARQHPLSTFSIDVDTASYSNLRRYITQMGTLPPKGAVRIEELINYFRYDYPQPEGDVPFSVATEVAGCPWNAEHRLVRIGLKGREIARDQRPPSNLVFLLDVSGSMSDANKLPLVREAMKLLAEQLTENDRVSIVVYASGTGVVLEPTRGDQQQKIRQAIDALQAGGSTNGSGGIQMAYELASRNFIKGGTNRVILATDGDFNVGIVDREQLITLITEQAKSGVFLTTLGFGMGNLKDGTLEQLANKGNGNYAYIDDQREAQKVFVEELSGTLITIARDVKIQVEFNPAEVAAYRLIGYENRVLAHRDFNDDKKDAGEIGAGHTVTALYEIVPVGAAGQDGERVEGQAEVDPLKYQQVPRPQQAANAAPGELLTVKLRYKQPEGTTSQLIESPVTDSGQPYGKASADFKFAASVALFGMILRESPHAGSGTLAAAAELASEGLAQDAGGYRAELLELIRQAEKLHR